MAEHWYRNTVADSDLGHVPPTRGSLRQAGAFSVSRFNRTGTKPAKGNSPMTTEAVATGRNFHDAPGFERALKTELFMLGVSNLVGQDSFYEKAGDRDSRYTTLIRQAAVEDPTWTADFLRWLRNDANMRSASLVGALETAKAMLDANLPGARKVVASVLRRADEPGEALAYWTSTYGRTIPKPVKRGVADAVTRLYNERSLLKYDTASKGYRFGDVINLVHPVPGSGRQGYLFEHALETRYGRAIVWGGNADAVAKAQSLPMLRLNEGMRKAAKDGWPLTAFDPSTLSAAGITWENALSMAGPDVDKKKLWEALIPTMGYMAKLRNLRNFDEAGVSDELAAFLAMDLADPEQVARSKQFPFRFYAAYLATQGSLRWSYALERALQASLGNVPALSGRTLVLVDQSPSMFPGCPGWIYKAQRSDMANADMAKLFGSAVALRAENADLISYGGSSQIIPFRPGDAVLTTMQKFSVIDYTDTFGAVARHWSGHDRIVIVTDEQNQIHRHATIDSALAMAGAGPKNVSVYLWNIGGYGTSSIGSGPNRNSFAGMTDAAFGMIPLIESGRDAAWPWIAANR
jgi:hypothetical protein